MFYLTEGGECLHEELPKAARRTCVLLCADIFVVGGLQACSGLKVGDQCAEVPNALVVVAVCGQRFAALGWITSWAKQGSNGIFSSTKFFCQCCI